MTRPPSRRAGLYKALGGGLSFGIVVSTVLALATGSAQVGLHAGFWLALVFTVWLEWRLAT